MVEKIIGERSKQIRVFLVNIPNYPDYDGMDCSKSHGVSIGITWGWEKLVAVLKATLGLSNIKLLDPTAAMSLILSGTNEGPVDVFIVDQSTEQVSMLKGVYLSLIGEKRENARLWELKIDADALSFNAVEPPAKA